MNKNIKRISILSMALATVISLSPVQSMDETTNLDQTGNIQPLFFYASDDDTVIDVTICKDVDYSKLSFFPLNQIGENTEINEYFKKNTKNSNLVLFY